MRSGPYGSESSAAATADRLERERLEHELGQLPQLDLRGVAGRLDRVLVHRHVLRAGDGEEVDPSERDGLVDPVLARALGVFALQLLHPDAPAAGAAAERVVPVAGHLDELAADAPQHLARRLVDAVEAAERARVVVRDAVSEPLVRDDRARVEQLEQELGVVHDLVRRPRGAELRVLVPERVVGVRVARQDAVELAAGDRLDVLLGERAEEPFLAGAAHVVAGRLLRLEEDSRRRRRLSGGCARAPGCCAGCAGRATRSPPRTRGRRPAPCARP